ncbi:MAG TPA: hypothetical protein VJP08_06220, partial [Actinomycetota bacterium]|nr:hypothetical protein [Actinomycetota bacterium]
VDFGTAAQVALLGAADREARDRAGQALTSGSAADVFRKMVEAQGGEPRVVDDPGEVLPRAPVVTPVPAERSGYVEAVDAEAIGRAAVALGAGRARKGDPVDPAVGILFRPKIGDRVEAEEPIGEVHARSEKLAAAVVRTVNDALRIVEHPVPAPPLVHSVVGTGGG